MKKIKQILLVLAMSFIAAGMAACGKSDSDNAPAFEFAEAVPSEMGIAEQVYFRNYLEENDDAEYKLYVSYYDKINGIQVTEKPLGSMIFILEQETEYTFKIERILNGKSTYLTCTINVLPETPKFQESGRIPTASKGATKTFEEIFTASQYVVTPGNLESQLQFLSYDFTSVVEGVDDQTDVGIPETATDFTFVNEGVYVFDVKAENAKGSAQTTITINAFNAKNASAKVETTYDPLTKTLSWEAIEGATAYRVWVNDNDYVEVTDATFLFTDETSYPDAEYMVKIIPVFDGTVYKGAAVTEPISVGRVYTALALTKEMDIVSWPTRYFVETYTVIENGQEYTYDADTLSHALQGTYATDTEVTVQVYGTFDNGNATETAEIKVVTGELGTTTLKQIQATAGVASNVEWVAFDMEEASNVWFLSEFVGKNAPNYGIQVLNLTSEWDGSYTVKKTAEGNKLGKEYTPGGMMLCNTSERAWKDIVLYRGYQTHYEFRGSVDDGLNMGMYNYKDNVHYIQIVGYEIIPENMTNNARLTAYLFTVDESGTLTLVNKSVGEATHATHVLGGTYATYYGNIGVNVGGSLQGPESVTFSYAKPAKTLNSLLYNITAAYEYRQQLITLCGATEPSAENNFVPARVIGEVYNDGRNDNIPDDGEDPDDGNDDVVVEEIKTLSEETTLNKVQATGGVTAAGTTNQYVSFDMGTKGGSVWLITQFTGKNAPNYSLNAKTSGLGSWTAENTSYNGMNAGTLITNSSEYNAEYLQVFQTTNTSKSDRANLGTGKNAGLKNFADDKEYIQIIGYENAGTNDLRAKITYYLFEISDGKATLVGSVVPTDANCSGYSFRTDGQYVVFYGNIECSGLDNDPDGVTFSYEAPKATLAELVNGLAENYAYKDDLKTTLNIQDVEPDDGNEEKPDDGNDDVVVGENAKLSEEATLNKVQATNGVTAEGTTNEYVAFDMGTKGGSVWIMTQFTGKNAPNYAMNAKANGSGTWVATDTVFDTTEAGVLITNSSEYNAEYLQVFNTTNTATGKARANLGSGKDAGLKNLEDGKQYIQIIGYENSGDNSKAKITYYLFEIASDGTATLIKSIVPTEGNGGTYSFRTDGQYVVLYGNIECSGLDNDPNSITFSYEAPKATLAELVNGLSENYAYKADLKSALNIQDVKPDDGQDPDDGNDDVVTEESKTLSQEATLNKVQATGGVTAAGTTNQYVSFDMGTKGGSVWIITQFKGKNAPNYSLNAKTNGLETWTAENTSYNGMNAGTLVTNSSEYNAEYLQVFQTTNTSKSDRANLGDGKAAGLKNFADDKEYIQIIGYENSGDSYKAKITYYLFEIGADGKATLIKSIVSTGANCAAYSFRTDGQYVVFYGNIECSGLDNDPDSVTFSYEAPKATLEDLINGLSENYAYKDDLKTALSID